MDRAARRRLEKHVNKTLPKIAECNTKLYEQLQELERLVPECTDIEERHRGENMIRRLRKELGEDLKANGNG